MKVCIAANTCVNLCLQSRHCFSPRQCNKIRSACPVHASTTPQPALPTGLLEGVPCRHPSHRIAVAKQLM